jgi:serine/threonine protein kinase
MWCLGAILYYLCTGETLFLNNDSDNTDNNSLLQLFEWTDVTKNDKLSKISDELARNLVSRLLSKDPAKRPLTSIPSTALFLNGAEGATAAAKCRFDTFQCFFFYKT